MQAKIPLFSQPPFRNLADEEYLTILDLSEDDDKQVTRLLTVFVQFYNDPPDGSYCSFALFNGDVAVNISAVIGGAAVVDSTSSPVRIADQIPIRGDTKVKVRSSVTGTGRATVFGYYTIAGTSGERVYSNSVVPVDVPVLSSPDFSGAFAYLDKRALQPDGSVPEDMTIPTDSAEAVHVVPTSAQTIDDVTVDIVMFYSTGARLYFEDYPDNFVGLRPSTGRGDRTSDTFLLRALDSVPFRAEGTLMLASDTGAEQPAARAIGHFVRY